MIIKKLWYFILYHTQQRFDWWIVGEQDFFGPQLLSYEDWISGLKIFNDN